jgi:ABC-type sugar transport system substrate-binding protein
MTEAMKIGVDTINARIHAINASRKDIVVDDLVTYSAEYKLDKQLSDIETITQTKPDVLIVSAVDPTGILPALKTAREAGIKVLDQRGQLDPNYVDCNYLIIDEVAGGQMLKGMVKKYLVANPKVKLNFGLIYHEQTITVIQPRLWGIRELAKEMPDRVTVLNEQYTGVTDKAMAIMEDWLQKYPTMNAVATAFDELAIGVVNVLKSANKIDDFFVASDDGTPQACEMLRKGYIKAEVGLLNGPMKSYVADLAVSLALGDPIKFEPGTKTYKYPSLYEITQQNVDEYLKLAAW